MSPEAFASCNAFEHVAAPLEFFLLDSDQMCARRSMAEQSYFANLLAQEE